MNIIREALMRRMSEGVSGGSGVPMIGQLSQPNTTLPGGGPNTPGAAPLPIPAPQPNQLPVQASQAPAGQATPTQQMAGVAQTAQGMPDDETRKIAKALLGKLVQFL